uniref:Putative secreted protein n=1 Tax=Amblyomma triste TaxID=251400 RepID=A0A023G334_AMBTT
MGIFSQTTLLFTALFVLSEAGPPPPLGVLRSGFVCTATCRNRRWLQGCGNGCICRRNMLDPQSSLWCLAIRDRLPFGFI